MATTKTVIIDALEELLEGEFKTFKWHLSNSDEPIPRGKLEKADLHDVVDLMEQHYNRSDAGKIAVRTLRKMKQNDLADRLKGKLQEVPEDVPDGARASSSGIPAPAPAQTAGVTMNITSNGGTVKAPVVHGCTVTGPMTFN
ncbi:caspase b-like [Pimephales promelas]|uniref:caspase b-like n=1 Tax=Pimephales promelas TaxID=90988 RepID=UPI0019559FD3|nr:caspase b-like [Pimephales promelas]KAG1955787.1 protein NLRC3-like [Pimephales promelas]